MSYETQVAPSLLDLIGRSWTLPGGVTEACFNRDGSAVAFAGGGRLAIATVADPERPETRMRRAADTGRQTILPRKNPVRPAAEADGLTGPVVPWGGKSFLTAGANGLISVTPRAQAVPVAAPLDGPALAIARDPSSSAVAVGDATGLVILPDDAGDAPQRHDLGQPVTALAYAPDGLLAIGDADGVALWVDGMMIQRLSLDQAPAAFGWSHDGGWLAVGFFEPGLALVRPANGFIDLNPDYPTAVASFGWSKPAGVFATSGAFRAIAWTLTPDGLGDPVEAGRGGLVVVDRVAASPDRPLLAVGYNNGLVCLNKIGTREEMMLRPLGAAITSLAWSPDGTHLAFGDAEGQATLIAFPPDLFK